MGRAGFGIHSSARHCYRCGSAGGIVARNRHFLDWDRPLARSVTEFLLPARMAGPADLEDTLIVVPSRQAGRRLDQALAEHCARRGNALLSARLITPGALQHPGNAAGVAGSLLVSAVWSRVLCEIEPAEYPAVFPAATPAPAFNWALSMGGMIQRLRESLAQAGHEIADVPRLCGAELEEPDRWRQLADLEEIYLSRLARFELTDPVRARLHAAAQPELPDGVRRIVLAAVPDPPALLTDTLQRLTDTYEIEILVHAPAERADTFDGWGRPIPERWRENTIDVPQPTRNIRVAASPRMQAEMAIDTLAGWAREFGPADLAVGLCDAAVTPVLENLLDEAQLPSFEPSDKPVAAHTLYRLLHSFAQLVTDQSYRALSRCLRHPDLLRCLHERHHLGARLILSQLDEFQNAALPAHLTTVIRLLRGRHETCPSRSHTELAAAVAFLARHVEAIEDQPIDRALRAFLAEVYETRTIQTGRPADDEFREVAELIDTTLRELPEAAAAELGFDTPEWLALFLKRLGQQRYHRPHGESTVELGGWLELAWNDAPCLVVCGMNEGLVPDTRTSDVFLPDTLRTALGLTDNQRRLARDAFLMCGLIESRRAAGRVCFIAAKTSRAGDPLQPSRLLLRCPESELAARAATLFGPVQERRRLHPASISFRLDPAPPPDVPAELLAMGRLSTTAFRDYLACPFRFYLKHILQMARVDDEKPGPDALDFGLLLHGALQRLAPNGTLCGCEDESTLALGLTERARQHVFAQYGKNPPLPVLIALDAAEQRLRAAASTQVQTQRDGWETILGERRLTTVLAGVELVGRIDRVDRHRETGRLRIIDYKSSDKAITPESAHIGPASRGGPRFACLQHKSRDRRWQDLQLPLYRLLLQDAGLGGNGPVELAYFALPKAVGDTGLAVWTDYSDTLHAAALDCAAQTVQAIRNRVFWPPAERPLYDEYAALFFGKPGASFDGRAMEALRRNEAS